MSVPVATERVWDSLYLKEGSGRKVPYVEGNKYLINGEVRSWAGPSYKVVSPILNSGSDQQNLLGNYAMMNGEVSLEALEAAERAYNRGRGTWPAARVNERIAAVERFLEGLKHKRDEIVELLCWEICKTLPDSQKEVDRTIKYIADTVKELKHLENHGSQILQDSGVFALVRRAPIGVVLCLGPFNYPFNETYTTLIPAIIMGNTVVMKLPRVGVLCHYPTLELFRECFPPGVVNIISGSGRETLHPLMRSAKVDIFAFIGTSAAADDLQKSHPKPHRLRICLGLEAKNLAVVMPDANLDVAVKECLLGSLSYNGQRCTALKILFVHKNIADEFISRFAQGVDNLKMGLPWEAGVSITPLPEETKPHYLQELVADAVSKGARVINARGGKVDRTFVAPTVVYPVNEQMRVYHEEQFGPLVPIRTFETIDEIYAYLDASPYGQQASVFSRDANTVSTLIDVLVNQVSRVNINSQCQRGPDSLPFTGRKDSAYGTLSVSDALRVFSLRALVAGREDGENQELVTNILNRRSSKFMRLDYVF